MERKIETQVKGFHAIDGGGVHLVRVLGNTTVKAFNPFLMLDSFDSTNPEDYVAGFPMHPHRGIETITFVAHGNMRHKDSMGFEDIVQDGEVQYMSAGSGILHEETIPASPRMCGLQLWLNLPAKDKMTKPSYKAIKKNEIPEFMAKSASSWETTREPRAINHIICLLTTTISIWTQGHL